MHPTSTGNMKRHIRRKHPKVFDKECSPITKKRTSVDYIDENLVDTNTDGAIVGDDIGGEMEIPGEDDSSHVQSESDEEIDDKLDKKINKLCNQPVLWGKTTRKTCIWNFFESIIKDEDVNVYRCTFCLQDISVDGKNVSNLKRHTKRHHTKEYQRILKYAPAYDSIHFEVRRRGSSRNISNSEFVDADNCSDSTHDNELDEFLIWTKNSEDDNQNENDLDNAVKELCNKPVGGRVKGKTCVWNFFTNVAGETVYRCGFCLKDVTIFPKSVSNLTRHITHCHPEVMQKIYKHAPSDDSLFKRKTVILKDDDAELKERLEKFKSKLDTESIETIKKLCNKSVSGKYTNKSCIWNFFESHEEAGHKCMFCKKEIIFSNLTNVSNLRRHIKQVHPNEYEAILAHAPVKDNLHKDRSYSFLKKLSCSAAATASVEFDKAYFEQLDDGSLKCKQCDETVECGEDQGILFSHIQEKHPDQVIMYQEQTEENEDFSLFIVNKE